MMSVSYSNFLARLYRHGSSGHSVPSAQVGFPSPRAGSFLPRAVTGDHRVKPAERDSCLEGTA